MGRRPRPTKEEITRRERWVTSHLPAIRKASRPNDAYISNPVVAGVLQHLADAVNTVLMSRPIEPFAWLADYLRHSCKVAYSIEQDASTVLIMEMHKKRRIIQNSLLDTRADEIESRRIMRSIITMENVLSLTQDELRLTADDLDFLAAETPRHQSLWSIETDSIYLPSPGSEDSHHEWVERHILPQRHIDEYVRVVTQGVTCMLVEMELVAPSNVEEWVVLHFKSLQSSSKQPNNELSIMLKTNYELTRKVDAIKQGQREMHLRRNCLDTISRQLNYEINVRQRFIDKLRVTNTTARTHAIMNGTPCFLNGQKLWILSGSLLVPEQLSPLELQGLRRAERYLMEEEETRWRFLVSSQKRCDASTRLQAAWKCYRDYRIYEAIKQRRRHAANIIQRNYFRYLYERAISLPTWCVVGQEVMISPAVAQRSAITFQFYPKKDFPTGNFKRVEGLSVAEMMEISRQDEGCAGFSTDGSFKRFVPRKLSQLREMAARENRPLSPNDGIYIKVFPSKTDKIVTTAIITAIPTDRFGLITVVFDGTGVEERVSIQKLSERWKRIRIRRYQKEKKRKAFVFGGHQIVEGEPDDATTTSSVGDFVVLDEDEAERRRRRERRVRIQSNEQEAKDPLLDFVYEDQSTKEVRSKEPHHTYADESERERVIAMRKQEYARRKAAEYEATKLQSVVRLQCAWRSRRAREAFRQVLQLRAKEKERDRLVDAAHAANQVKIEQRRAKKQGFFAKWLAR